MFRIAHKNGYNKIAFGHHRDDVIVTFMMDLLFHGEVATSVPVQKFFEGKIKIIRSLYFLREDWIEYFIRDQNLPTFTSNCPHEWKSKRDEIKNLLIYILMLRRTSTKQCLILTKITYLK